MDIGIFIAIIALIVSIISFLYTAYVNRRTRKTLIAEKRTQVLAKLSELRVIIEWLSDESRYLSNKMETIDTNIVDVSNNVVILRRIRKSAHNGAKELIDLYRKVEEHEDALDEIHLEKFIAEINNNLEYMKRQIDDMKAIKEDAHKIMEKIDVKES